MVIQLIDEYFENRIHVSNPQEFEEFICTIKVFDVIPHDYDKRCRAMADLLNNPKANRRYNTNQAINLANVCLKNGRSDLYNYLLKILTDGG